MPTHPAEPGSTRISPGRRGAPLPAVSLLCPLGRWWSGIPLLAAIALLSSCTVAPPKQPPLPETCIPDLSAVVWAHEVGRTCSSPNLPVKHQRPGDACPSLVRPCPTPTPTAQPKPGRCPQGKPQARGPTPHGRGVWDATPAVCKADWTPDCYTGRYCHPVACEGSEAAEDRGFCEEQLMGGPAPVWELDVTEGSLCLVPSDWFAILGGKKGGFCRRGSGSGKARLRWRFPNSKAASKWIEVSR